MNSDNANLFRAAALYIYEHIDDKLSLESVAARVGTSTSSLKRAFQDIAEQSPGAFIRRIRLEFALRSLQDRQSSVLQTALAAGFEDHSALTLQRIALNGGPHAAFKYFGRINNIGLALHYVYGDWCARTQTTIITPPLFLTERIPQPGIDLHVRILVPILLPWRTTDEHAGCFHE